METKLTGIFRNLCKANDEILKDRKDIMPMCFIISKDYSIKLCPLLFGDGDEKQVLRNSLLKMISRENLLGYVLIMDCKKTIMGDGEPQVVDCVIRTLFTPKEMVKEMVDYKDGKVISKQEFNDRTGMRDEWDYWNVSPAMKSERLEEYWKFKEDNKDLYKGVN